MRRLLIVVAWGLVLAGCNRQDQNQEAIELGNKRVKVGAFREAIRAYESALDGTAKTADVHYKIAVLYDDKLKSPISAIHHYDRYLEFAPTGSHAKEAKAARADCDKQLHVAMKEGGFMTVAEAARLRNENETLRKSIAELLNPKPLPQPRVAKPNEADALPPGARKHLVGKGETLASIAFKYYRNRSQASHIKDANFNQLGGKDVIKPGMTLIIPQLPAKKRP
jgi:nucleoid-associated protein YgaU